MRSWRSLLLVLLGVISSLLLALPSPAAQPTKTEFSSALDERVAGIMQRQQIPGMAVVVIADGQVQGLKGYGVADTTTQQPVTADTKFVIGSNTKPFTTPPGFQKITPGNELLIPKSLNCRFIDLLDRFTTGGTKLDLPTLR